MSRALRALGFAGAGLIAPVWAWYIEPRWVDFTRHEVGLSRLPDSLSGFRIVHLSDIHASRAVPLRFVRRVVDRINEDPPDLVVVTGDLVTEDATRIEGLARELGRLRADHGVFAILGNHDFWTDGARISRTLEAAGVHHLRNSHHRIGGPGGLCLVGIDDHWTGEDDLEAALGGVGTDECTLLLMHSPDLLGPAAQAGIDLALCGHTHGGQVRLPWQGALVVPSVFGFEQGWYSQGSTRMYVNRGLGTLPIRARFGCRPEVCELTLLPA